MILNDNGFFRDKDETRMTHFRHRGVLMAEDDRIVFLYKNGDRAEVMFGDIDNIEIDHLITFIHMKDGRTLMFTPRGTGYGAISNGISSRRINTNVYNTLNYLLEKYGDKNKKTNFNSV